MLIMVAKFSMISSIIKFVFLLLVFFVLLFAASWFTKWYAKSGMLRKQQGNIELMESYPIGQGKVLQIVKAGNRYFLIAQAKDTITYLTELSEEELHWSIPETGKTAGFQDMFAEILHKREKSNK